MKNPWVIIGIITVLLFGGALWFSGVSADRNNEGVEVVDHIKGNVDAEVSLVEYSDFECPACASFQPVIKQILDQYGEQMSFEYKHFPLPIHSHAVDAAVAAEAAGQQGKFFEFHDVLFAKQSEWSAMAVPNTAFIKYASEIGLDVAQFRNQLKSSILKDHVRAEFNESRELGLTGTPTFFLNGEKMEFETYQSFVEQIAVAIDPSAATSSTTETLQEEVRFGL